MRPFALLMLLTAMLPACLWGGQEGEELDGTGTPTQDPGMSDDDDDDAQDTAPTATTTADTGLVDTGDTDSVGLHTGHTGDTGAMPED